MRRGPQDLATTLNYEIGVREGSDELAAAIQDALNGLIESGHPQTCSPRTA